MMFVIRGDNVVFLDLETRARTVMRSFHIERRKVLNVCYSKAICREKGILRFDRYKTQSFCMKRI